MLKGASEELPVQPTTETQAIYKHINGHVEQATSAEVLVKLCPYMAKLAMKESLDAVEKMARLMSLASKPKTNKTEEKPKEVLAKVESVKKSIKIDTVEIVHNRNLATEIAISHIAELVKEESSNESPLINALPIRNNPSPLESRPTAVKAKVKNSEKQPQIKPDLKQTKKLR